MTESISTSQVVSNRALYPSEKNEKINGIKINNLILNKKSSKWKFLLKLYKEQVEQEKVDKSLYILEAPNQQNIFFEFYVDYLHIATTQLDGKLSKMQEKYKEMSTVVDIKKIRENLINSILNEFIGLSIRTLIQDLHELREKGKLLGNDSVERFQYYSQKILSSKEKKLELLTDYPILSRVLLETITAHIDNGIELLECFMQDRDQLIQTFQLGNHSKLLSLSLQLGDSHNGGKTVMCLNFGMDKKIMYKPRSLSIDLHFQQFLQWVNDKSSSLYFKTLTVLDKGHYGWQEYVKHKPCKSTYEITQFYQRQGSFMKMY